MFMNKLLGLSVQTDPNFNQTVLLINGDQLGGTNHLSDLSTNNNSALMKVGNPYATRFSPYNDQEYSIRFTGSGSNVVVSYPLMKFTTGDWCIDFWFYTVDLVATSSTVQIFTTGGFTLSYNTHGIYIANTTTSFPSINNSAQCFIDSDQWYHVAISSSDEFVSMFVNGNLINRIYFFPTTNAIYQTAAGFGGSSFTMGNFNGYLADVRITAGQGGYFKNFIPPSVPSKSITSADPNGVASTITGDVILLTLKNITFVDNSNRHQTLNVENATTSDTNPFTLAPSTAYSGAFNNSYITVDNDPDFNFADSDFSLELWYNPSDQTAGSLVNTLGTTTITDGFNLYQQNDFLDIKYAAGNVKYDTLADYQILTFTSNNTLTLDRTQTADILVIGGGGGGEYGNPGAGGGAGGIAYATSVTMPAGIYNISIGNGGSGGVYDFNGGIKPPQGGGTGGTSTITGPGGFTTITRAGGSGINGSSGPDATGAVHARTTGLGGAGASGVNKTNGDGGDGVAYDITGTNVYYAGGGSRLNFAAGLGTDNFGGGGHAGNYVGKAPGNGNKGAVIIRLKSGNKTNYLAFDNYTNGVAQSIRVADVPTNSWNAVAVTRSQGETRLFLNGVLQNTFKKQYTVNPGATGLDAGAKTISTVYTEITGNIGNTSNAPLIIGDNQSQPAQASSFTGYIADLRIIKNQSVVNTSYLPSTTPLTKTAVGASAITYGDTRAVFAQDRNFKNTVGLNAYSAIYTGTNAQQIELANDITYQDNFVMECWFFLRSDTPNENIPIIVIGQDNAPDPYVDGSQIGILARVKNQTLGVVGFEIPNNDNTADLVFYSASVKATVNAWNHVLLQRRIISGVSTVIGFVNGVSAIVQTARTFLFAGTSVRIGNDFKYGTFYNGYLSNARITFQDLVPFNTSAGVTGFIPLRNNLSANSVGHIIDESAYRILNVSMINPTNVQVLTLQSDTLVDHSPFAREVLDIGPATVITPYQQVFEEYATNTNSSVKLFSPFGKNRSQYGSTLFPGIQPLNYANPISYKGSLVIPSTSNLVLGSKDFTLELWHYPNPNTDNSAMPIVSNHNNTAAGNSWALVDGIAGGNPLVYYFVAHDLDSVNPIVTGIRKLSAWNHVAVTRKNNNFTMYVNGIKTTTATVSGSIDRRTQSNLQIGGASVTSINTFAEGYVSNLRLVLDQVLFTENFKPGNTPPTSTTVSHYGANVASSITGNLSVLTLTNSVNFNSYNYVDISTVHNVIYGNATPVMNNSDSPFNTSGSGSASLSNSFIRIQNADILQYQDYDFTIETWFKDVNTSLSTAEATLINFSDNATKPEFYVGIKPNTKTLSLYPPTNNPPAVYNTNSWNHVAVVKGNDNISNKLQKSMRQFVKTNSGAPSITYQNDNYFINNERDHDFTMEFWFYKSANDTFNGPVNVVICEYQMNFILGIIQIDAYGSNPHLNFALSTFSNTVYKSDKNIFVGDYQPPVSITDLPVNDHWYRIVIAKKDKVYNFYFNGVKVYSSLVITLKTTFYGMEGNNYMAIASFSKYINFGRDVNLSNRSLYYNDFRFVDHCIYDTALSTVAVPTDSSSVISGTLLLTFQGDITDLSGYNTSWSGESFDINSAWVPSNFSPFNSKSNYAVYLNGISIFSGNLHTPISSSVPANITFGANYNSTGYFNGLLSNTRFTANAIVSGNFIPSTTPLTSNAAGHIGTNVNANDLTGQVHFLLGSDPNGGLIDITGKGIVRSTGFAKGTDTLPKYGIGSIQYNGFTDSVYMLGDGCLYGFGTSDYTIEFWCNFDDVLRTQYLYDGRIQGQTGGSYIAIYLNYAVQFTQVGTTGSAYDVQSGASSVVFTVQDASTVAGITSNYAVGNKIRASLPNPAQGYVEATITDYTNTQLTATVINRYGTGSGTSWIVSDAANGTITASINSNTRIEGVTASPNQWYFITLTRYLNTVKFFIDGVLQGTDTASLDNYGCATNRPIFGVNGSTGNTNWFRGWMDDIRITKFSRYFDPFDPPTSALPITGVPPAPPKIYRVFTATANADEGNTVNFAITAINFGSGKLYYTILGPNVTASDFADNTLSGEITIISDGANFTKEIAADMLTEGPETFVFQVRTGSITGPIVATSSPVIINDTSTTPPPTYEVAVDVSRIYEEGNTATFAITTARVGNAVLFWTNSGTTVAADFDGGVNSGQVVIANDSGTKALTLTLDHLTEGTETIVFELRTGSTIGPIVATASVVVVADTSINAPVFKVTPDKITANEGDTVTWNIQTFYYGSGTLYYTITGTVTAPDFTTLGGGLQLTKYNDYFNNNIPYFDNTTPVRTTQTVSLSLTNVTAYTSYMYTGWFLADYTGTWTFSMTTGAPNDDLAYFWIGVNAAANYTPLNALLAEKGQHLFRTKSANINLVKGSYYPFRIAYGNHMGAGSLEIKYSNLLVTNSTDFTGKLFFSPDGLNGGKIEGPVAINNDSGSITKTLALDFLTEGMENAVLLLRTGSTSGPVVYTADTVNINDTSIAPVPSYAIVPDATSVDEDGLITFAITTTNFGTGTMYWKNIGTSSIDDFSTIFLLPNIYEGTVDINNDSGQLDLFVNGDLLTEGPETIQIQLRLNSQTDPVIATSVPVTINDTSTTPPPSYSITADRYTMNESDVITFTFDSANTPDATYTWRNTGTTTAADFVEGINTGTFTTVGGTATFILTTAADLLTEGTETIIIVVKNNSNVDVTGTAVASVADTSTTPPPTYAITPSIQTTNEGTTVTYTVQTTNYGNGILFWTNRGTTSAVDFTDNVNSGSVTISNNIGFFTRPIKNDLLTEGDETIIMDLRTDSISGAVVSSSVTTTVKDTSIPLVVGYSITPSTTVVGETAFNKTYTGTTYDTFLNTNLGTGPFTIEGWFKPTNLNQGLNFFGMSNGPGSVPKLAVYINNGKLTVDMGSVGAPAGQFPFALTPSDWGITAGAWFHLALVRESTATNGFKIYINGVLAGTSTNNVNLSSLTGKLYYAYMGEAFGSYFVGTIQNFYLTLAAVYTAPFTPIRTTTTTVTWSIQTTNYGSGTLYWINKGSTTSIDFLEKVNSGTINVVNNNATLVLNVVADSYTEGRETIIISLYTDITQPAKATAATVTVVDSSITPVFQIIPKLSGSNVLTTSMNEGDTIVYYINTGGFGTGTLYYSNGSGNLLANQDLADNTLEGSITVVNDVATLIKTVLMDKWLEGLNSFGLTFRTLSSQGPVVSQTPVVSVLDASTMPTTLATGIYGRGYKGTPIANGVYNPYWTQTAVVQKAAVSAGPIGYAASYAQLDPNGYTVEYTGYFQNGLDNMVTLSVTTNLAFAAWIGAWAVPQKDGNWGSLTVADPTAVMSYIPATNYGTAQSFTRTYDAMSYRLVPIRIQIYYPNAAGTPIWQMGYTNDSIATPNPTSTDWNMNLKYNTSTNGI